MLLSLGFLATAVEVEASDKQKESTFEAIYLSNNLPDVVPVPPTSHISVEKRIAESGTKKGQLLSLKDIGGESTLVSDNFASEKLSMNVGGGIIASHKNIKLEFLYDMQKQKSYKAHPGILKLKVNL